MVELISSTNLDAVHLAVSQPYGSKNPEITLATCLRKGHWSVLEHCYVSFKIKCSYKVIYQMTRHRHLSFTVSSTRYREMEEFVNPINIDIFDDQQ
jgi:thymidylate synthase ThyX